MFLFKQQKVQNLPKKCPFRIWPDLYLVHNHLINDPRSKKYNSTFVLLTIYNLQLYIIYIGSSVWAVNEYTCLEGTRNAEKRKQFVIVDFQVVKVFSKLKMMF